MISRRKHRALKALLKPRSIDEYRLWKIWFWSGAWPTLTPTGRDKRLIERRQEKWKREFQEIASNPSPLLNRIPRMDSFFGAVVEIPFSHVGYQE